MDAKSKANFINSVAAGQSVPCPKCGRENKAGSKFCVSCGTPLAAAAPADNAPVSKPASEPAKPAEPAKAEKPAESATPFQPVKPSEPAKPPVQAAASSAQPQNAASSASPFKSVESAPEKKADATQKTVTPRKPVKPEKKAVHYVEPSNAFAQGLPSWSLEPPMVMVRRH